MSVKMVRAHLSFADEHRGDGQHHMGDLYIHFLVELALMQISINTQVIIQNRALSLARYLGLSADNHLDRQNGCQ